jgi:hypothetical protein
MQDSALRGDPLGNITISSEIIRQSHASIIDEDDDARYGGQLQLMMTAV